jgi:hypothetical protein
MAYFQTARSTSKQIYGVEFEAAMLESNVGCGDVLVRCVVVVARLP